MFENRERLLIDLIDLIGQPDFYEDIALKIRSATNSDTSGIWHINQHGELLNGSYTTGMQPHDLQEYQEEFAAINPIMAKATPVLLAGGCARKSDYISMSSHRDSFFFQEYERRHHIFWEMGQVVRTGLAAATLLSLGRDVNGSDFTDAETFELTQFSVGLSSILKAHERHTAGLSSSCDNRLLVGADGCVLSVEGALANQLLNEGDNISTIEKWISCQTTSSSGHPGFVMPSGSSMDIEYEGILLRLSMRNILEYPLNQSDPGACFELTVELHEPRFETAMLWLGKKHKLTAREIEMAYWLLEGGSILGFADQFDVSVHTARIHAKHLMGKTEQRSQNAFIAWINRELTSLGCQRRIKSA